ncbi:MAG TPA: pitrilysin family protein, partial [Vicinamibacterales bacterium]|nr:pitrilysin family protein [Vicinamibacterales bacterium]
FQRNSIPGLAAVWSDALAAEGRMSPDEDVQAIRSVTAAAVNRMATQYLVASNSITATLVPKPSGAPVPSKGFGGGEQLTAAPTKPVALPAWASAALAELRVPKLAATWTDTRLANGIRLIVKRETTSNTVTLIGSIRQEPDLQVPPHQEGVDSVLEDLFSYGTTSRDRIAFQKALDDIAASESAGASFSLNVLAADFSRGVELLADNELHPALPPEAFAVVKKQTHDFVAGRVNTPGYRESRARVTALLPTGDPALRDATPDTVASVTLEDVRQYYAKTFRPDLTTIAVIGDIEPDQAKAVVEKWFGGWKASGAKPALDLPAVPRNKPSAVAVPDPQAVQASVTLDEEIGLTRYDPDYYALQVGNHVLGGGFYATRLYHDLRQVAGLVYTVDNGVSAGRTRGTFSVDYGCDPANVDKARDLIVRDLRAMQTTNVTDAELHQAKALLLRQIPLGEASERAVAGGLLGRAQMDLPLDEPARAAARYAAITADQVRAAFAKWIRPEAFAEVVRGPADGASGSR